VGIYIPVFFAKEGFGGGTYGNGSPASRLFVAYRCKFYQDKPVGIAVPSLPKKEKRNDAVWFTSKKEIGLTRVKVTF